MSGSAILSSKHLLQLETNGDEETSRAASLLRHPEELVFHHEWAADVRRALTLVVAEYVRVRHAQRSAEVVKSPVETIGLASPRTHLIPERLFGVLGEICRHHGRTFEETMSLPHEESGMGHDMAHPRFVACMLRLGDLLDLDNGRFCPVLIRSFGDLPSTSQAHVHKHAAIRHLRVSESRIEVEAVSDNYAGYEVTESWFRWLRNELRDQSSRWAEIAPHAQFGSLAAAGRIQAVLIGHLSLPTGKQPRFEVDREALVKLVQGANLYPDRFSCIRELLQNAVDATLLRAWLEKREHGIAFDCPANLRSALARWPIDVRFKRKAEDGNGVTWGVTIQDRGTGIELQDLNRLLRVGGGREGRLARAVRDMPKWAQPSGVFGIGLHSVFLASSELVLWSRHHQSGAGLKITLRDPDVDDGVLVREMTAAECEQLPKGTKVEFDILVDAIPHRVESTFGFEVSKVMKSFDPILDDELPFAVAYARDKLRECLGTFCTVRLDGEELPQSSIGEFDPETGLEVQLEAAQHGRTRLSYRGMPVTSAVSYVHPMLVRCNVHAGDARELLTLNREKLTRNGDDLVRSRLNTVMPDLLERYLDQLRSGQDSGDLALASLSALLWEVPTAQEEWRAVLLPNSDSEIRLGEIADGETVRVTVDTSPTRRSPTSIEWSNNEIRITIDGHLGGWLQPFLQRLFSGVCVSVVGGKVSYTFSKTPGERITTEAVRYVLSRLSVSGWVGNRVSFPTPVQFDALSIDLTRGNWARSEFAWIRPRMVSPFVAHKSATGETMVRVPGIREYVEWTVEHAAESAPVQEVALATLGFLKYADPLISPDHHKQYSLSECEQILADLVSM